MTDSEKILREANLNTAKRLIKASFKGQRGKYAVHYLLWRAFEPGCAQMFHPSDAEYLKDQLTEKQVEAQS